MSRREFPVSVQKAAKARAGDDCEHCHLPLGGETPEYHHVKEDFFDGPPTLENCMVVHKRCHAWLTAQAAPRMAKTRRQANKAAGIKAKGRPMPGSRASQWKCRLTSAGQKMERR